MTICAQIEVDPWAFYSFVPGSMPSILATVPAKFQLIEVNADHRRVSGVLEVEQQRNVKVKSESDAKPVVLTITQCGKLEWWSRSMR